jgi:hypothetical protein
LAKCDSEWLSGASLKATLGGSLTPFALLVCERVGVRSAAMYRTAAVAILVYEAALLLVALRFAVAARRAASVAFRACCFALAAILHVSFELSGFEIEFFSHYMLLLWLYVLAAAPSRNGDGAAQQSDSTKSALPTTLNAYALVPIVAASVSLSFIEHLPNVPRVKFIMQILIAVLCLCLYVAFRASKWFLLRAILLLAIVELL